MLNKYEVMSIRNTEELLDTFEHNKNDYFMILEKALEMKWHETFILIIGELKGIQFAEFKKINRLIVRNRDEFSEYLDSLCSALLTFDFEFDFENYTVCKKVAELISAQKTFNETATSIKYLNKLNGVVRDVFLKLHIEITLCKLQNEEYSVEQYEYLIKCIEAKKQDENYRAIANRIYKELLCGFYIKNQDIAKKSDGTVEIVDKTLWDTVIQSDTVPLSEEMLLFLIQNDFNYEVTGNQVTILPYEHNSFNKKVFRVSEKYEERRESKISVGIAEKDEETEPTAVKDKKEAVLVEQTKTVRPNKFSRLYNIRNFVYDQYEKNVKDDEYEERVENYEEMMRSRDETISRKRAFYEKMEERTRELEEKLCKRIQEKQRVEIERRIMQEAQEREEREKAESKKRWYNTSNSFVKIDYNRGSTAWESQDNKFREKGSWSSMSKDVASGAAEKFKMLQEKKKEESKKQGGFTPKKKEPKYDPFAHK
ncbi:hypothetical protein ECANGB1_629 [Enterospora canceri]|uniref:Uncharacterized protein n=1 Tax=Enterospora canceri TaxID=1081671 RepID=A0A1Y1S7S9_9MICR|nr:hypothetical protein ECANGB1_629 [Enterospora canceri]